MKKYSQLYPNNNEKKQFLNISRSPKKCTPLMGVTFSSKNSNKTIGVISQNYQRSSNPYFRTLARSIEENHIQSDIQNQQAGFISIFKVPRTEDELFSQSYARISKIRQIFKGKPIDHELNQVLNLIQTEKLRISEKIKKIRKDNQYYRRLCEGYSCQKMDNAMNTEELIDPSIEIVTLDKQVQCQYITSANQHPSMKSQSASSVKQQKKNQVLQKLKIMLQQMKISPKDILPEDIEEIEDDSTKEYKLLSDFQIIKIQKFFMKKLYQKLPKLP